MASFDALENLLDQASKLLDKAADQIRDLELNPQRNVRRIGEAIVLASEIRNEMYERRPDLKPDYLKQ